MRGRIRPRPTGARRGGPRPRPGPPRPAGRPRPWSAVGRRGAGCGYGQVQLVLRGVRDLGRQWAVAGRAVATARSSLVWWAFATLVGSGPSRGGPWPRPGPAWSGGRSRPWSAVGRRGAGRGHGQAHLGLLGVRDLGRYLAVAGRVAATVRSSLVCWAFATSAGTWPSRGGTAVNVDPPPGSYPPVDVVPGERGQVLGATWQLVVGGAVISRSPPGRRNRGCPDRSRARLPRRADAGSAGPGARPGRARPGR